jgi:hypothetical protein
MAGQQPQPLNESEAAFVMGYEPGVGLAASMKSSYKNSLVY